MGWDFPCVETTDTFNTDFIGGPRGPGLNVYIGDGDKIFRTYTITGRGMEQIGSVWALLDLTPYGRQETWEDAPEGVPQSEPYHRWRLHDEYAC